MKLSNLHINDHSLQGKVLEMLRNYACPHCGNSLLKNNEWEDSLSEHPITTQDPLKVPRTESTARPTQKHWGPLHNRWLNSNVKATVKSYSLTTKPKALKVIEAKLTTNDGSQHFTVTSTRTHNATQLRTSV